MDSLLKSLAASFFKLLNLSTGVNAPYSPLGLKVNEISDANLNSLFSTLPVGMVGI